MPTDQTEIVNARDERLKALALYVDNMPFKPTNHWEMLTQMVKDLGERREELEAPNSEVS